jgi:uncharacterized protein YcbK (DUF882 family)
VRVCSARKAGLEVFSSCAARRIGLAAVLLAAGSQWAGANGDIRTISLYHVHTHENLTITYKKNGHYHEEALKKINWHLRDWRKDQETKMDPQAIDLLWEVHQEVGAKEPIHIIGGYRSPDTNAMLRRRSKGVARSSQHMVGKAIDFFIPGVPLDAIRAAGLRLHGGGVGFYPTSGSPFVHMDVGSIRHWPRMTREQLAKVFPDGRTVHVPTDGNPLPGYQLALADVERGVHHRSVAPQKKRSLIASLLGGSQDQEEADDRAASRQAPAPATPSQAASAKRAATIVAAATAAKPAPMMLAAAGKSAPAPAPVALENTEIPIPLPRGRPTFEIASIDSRPAAPAVPRPPMDIGSSSPSDIINARGFWQGLRDAALAAPATTAQGSPDNLSSARRVLASAAMGSREPEATATVGPFARPDRVPPELALAYAAQAGNQVAPPQLASASSMPVALPNRAPPALVTSKGAASVAIKPAETAAEVQRERNAERLNDRLNDPWLRGLVMASSVRNAMTVTVFGDPDYRGLVQYMRKPASTVMMTFSPDPHLGMTSEAFTGSAVVFQATVTFDERRHATFEDRRTAALR